MKVEGFVSSKSFMYLLLAEAYLFEICEIPPLIPCSNIINMS